MLVVMWLAAILAGAIHVAIFCMESLWWTTSAVRAQGPNKAPVVINNISLSASVSVRNNQIAVEKFVSLTGRTVTGGQGARVRS